MHDTPVYHALFFVSYAMVTSRSVAIMYASGPLSAPPASVYLWLNSTRKHLVRPLQQAGAVVSVHACLDQNSKGSALPAMLQDVLHARVRLMQSACDDLTGDALRCCTSVKNDCDTDFVDRKYTWQWYRQLSCFSSLIDAVPFDYVIRARVDLWWVDDFPVALINRGQGNIVLRYKSACHLGEPITLGTLQQAYYKIGPKMCSDTNPPMCGTLNYACGTFDDQFALVPAHHAPVFFQFAAQRLTPAYAELRKRVRPCAGWRTSEGRLTEYLLANSTPVKIEPLPVELAGSTIKRERQMPPRLVVGDPDWDPSTQIRCALRNESSGVGAWMLEAGILEGLSPSQLQLVLKQVGGHVIMKHVHGSSAVRSRVRTLVPLNKRALFDSVIETYAARYLTRKPSQSYLIDQRDIMRQYQRDATVVTALAGKPRAFKRRLAESHHKHRRESGIALTFVVQYWHHPRQLAVICARLQHPQLEVIVHADSNSSDDHAAFTAVMRAHENVRIIQSNNIHEIRGYNLAAVHSKGWLLAFSQDDRLPPVSTNWVDSVVASFVMIPKLGLLGLHRGSPLLFHRRQELLGTCGDAKDRADAGTQWHLLPSKDMVGPVMAAAWLNMGPLVIRQKIFRKLGGFNDSYSEPGKLGIGYDGELTARAVLSGHYAALVCPSRATYFRNGCGGKATTKTNAKQRERVIAGHVNEARFMRHFKASEKIVLAKVREAQVALFQNRSIQLALARLFPNCSRCSASRGRGTDFHEVDHLCRSNAGPSPLTVQMHLAKGLSDVQWERAPAANHRPAAYCRGPRLPNTLIGQCMDSSIAQRACEEHGMCAGLHFDGYFHACRMLICADGTGHSTGRRSGDLTQRFAARAGGPAELAGLLHSISNQGCSPSGFMMRHLISQHSLMSFSGTAARYFTIVETLQGTWLVWKDGVINGELSYALLEGADAARPTLWYQNRRTFLSEQHEAGQQARKYLLSHNTALLIHEGRMVAIGGRHMGDSPNEDGVYLTSTDAAMLPLAVNWSVPRMLFDGHVQGCIDGRINVNGISPLVRHGVCEYDGRLSLVHFQGRYLLYARANPTLGRRFVQVTSSVDLSQWTPLRSISMKSIDACGAIVYTFAAQRHPLHESRLVAFFPAIVGCTGSSSPEGPRIRTVSGLDCKSPSRQDSDSRLANASLMISCSANGHSWSKPFPLFLCRSSVGLRVASLPVSNGLRLVGNRLFVWVHQDVPYDRRLRGANRSKVVRYELDGAAFRSWSAQECDETLEPSAPIAADEKLRLRPYNSSHFMRSLAKLWYSQRGQEKELNESGFGWCGGHVPLAPWARSRQMISHVNDDFFFNETWLNGLPNALGGQVNVTSTGMVEVPTSTPQTHNTLSTSSESCSRALATQRSKFGQTWYQSTISSPPDHHADRNRVWLYHKHRLIYVENQRAASRELRRLLSQALRQFPQRIFSPYMARPSKYVNNTQALKAVNHEALMSYFESRRFVVATFVREPIDTFISGYHELSHRWRGKPNNSTWQRLPCNTPGPRFSAFVNNLLRWSPGSLGIQGYHVWPQVLKTDVLPPGTQFDFIGKVETLSESLAALAALLTGRLSDSNRAVHAARMKPKPVRQTHGSGTDRLRTCDTELKDETAVNISTATTVQLCQLLEADYTCYGYELPPECSAVV